jgi:hypothetical protein
MLVMMGWPTLAYRIVLENGAVGKWHGGAYQGYGKMEEKNMVQFDDVPGTVLQ